MAKLIYSTITSLDGYVEDSDGNIVWGAPDEEVLTFINDLERPVGTYLYGATDVRHDGLPGDRPHPPDQSPAEREFTTIWQAAEKIVYSTTLPAASSARTRIERHSTPRP